MNFESATVAAIGFLWAMVLITACVAPYVRDAWNTFQLGRANIRLYRGETDPRERAWEVTRYAAEFERLSKERVKAQPPRLPDNVVRLNTRAARRGHTLHLDGPGAA